MLVHICCSVDSHFFLQKLQKLYPEKKLTGFFYDPNIHPFSEYQLRLLDVQRSCKNLGITLLEGDYDYEGWIRAVRGFEDEPEKGERCTICFDNRLEVTAKKALEIGETEITTTLLTSPKKSIEQLRQNAQVIEQKFGLSVATPDFRTGGGTQEQFALAKDAQLYHQNYCGCMYALLPQRENQNRLADELSSPLGAQVQPSSIEERIELYSAVCKCEDMDQKFKLKREKFLNYRLMRGYVREQQGAVIASYILFYSLPSREFIKGKVTNIADDIGYFNRDEILFVPIKKVNEILNTQYATVSELCKNPPKIEDEIKLRTVICNSFLQTLNPIIIVNSLNLEKYEIYINAKTYTDIREVLVKIS